MSVTDDAGGSAITGTVLEADAVQRILRIGGPELLRRLIGLYIENGPHRLRLLEDGLACGDFGMVERAAHTLKSSAGNVGAARLQQLAESLEAAAAAGRVDEAAAGRVREAYDESAAALRRLLLERDG